MLCKDGVDVPWTLCNSPGTSLTSAELLALIDKNADAATRFVAHASLTRAQIHALYSCNRYTTDLGLRRRMCGKRILQSGLFDYCRGLGQNKLIQIFSNAERRSNRRELLKALLAAA